MQIKDYDFYLNLFNGYLSEFFDEQKISSKTLEACEYSLKCGGKRIRPILCLVTADMLGIPFQKVKYYALALEMIHTYSLVHDDLPCMDNDDYRRGQLSTHKKYGEAFGVLAGDGLLNLSVEICLKTPNFDVNDKEAMKVLYDYSGVFGMILGQNLDILGENKEEISENDLFDIYINKTSKLLTAPLLIASCLADKKYFEQLKSFGEKLGVLFQITDDILDVEADFDTLGKTPNKDVEQNKLTSITVYGLDGAKQKAKELYFDCISILAKVENSQFLSEFTTKIYNRKK